MWIVIFLKLETWSEYIICLFYFPSRIRYPMNPKHAQVHTFYFCTSKCTYSYQSVTENISVAHNIYIILVIICF